MAVCKNSRLFLKLFCSLVYGCYFKGAALKPGFFFQEGHSEVTVTLNALKWRANITSVTSAGILSIHLAGINLFP